MVSIEQTQVRVNAERLFSDFNELAAIGATVEGGVSRLALSNEDLQARAWLAERFEEAGIFVRDDDAGNLSGVLTTDNPKAKTLLIGSHLDSVPNGGRFDSSVGVLAALESLRVIYESGIKLPFHLEAVNFTDEEGCWHSLFGSQALTGVLNENFLRDRDGDHGPFRAALFRAGIRPADVYRARRDPHTVCGYVELHIEQGRRLHQEGLQIGVVTDVVGRTTYHLIFLGAASHSGTTAREDRRDALLGAASFVTEAYRLVESDFPLGVFNCGNLEVFPGAFNVIPERALLVMECRHIDEDRMALMEEALIHLAQDQAALHHLTVDVHRQIHMPAVALAPKIIQSTETACQQLGLRHRRIISYAGHDAQIMSSFAPSGMIFIPSVNGVSHSPREYTEWQDVVNGANVLLHTILNLA
jgi:N-carbamoyl-L-amino-acid hydrolase